MYRIISLCTALLFSGLLLGQASKALQQLQVDLVYLASDYLEGRETGLKGEQLAAEYIAWRYEQIGLTPKGDNGSWMNKFDLTFKTNPHAATGEERTGRNVIAYIDNNAPTTVVIGAHYDHVGYGSFGSRHAGEPAIHNGADDNASGVAALLYIAEQLKDNSTTANNNYLFIAFSGEELGLVGSKKWVATPTIDLGTVNYMINMDMVGHLNEEKVLVINGVGTSPAWTPALEDIKVGGINLKTTESGVGASDHTSFYLEDIPSLHFFSGQHNYYHKPVDDADKINFPGLLSISDFMLALIEKLDDAGELEFTATKNENQGRAAASFKVSLGVMPDYVYGGKGMRVDSVIEDRPGQKAGMKDGDVIIKIGDLEVGDIYDYMEGLSKHNKGDQATVIVKRGAEEVSLKVTF
ncbi:MAG: M20/M25/M40 family metallo-hydrolase [Bacteroidota bacterium]